MPRYDYSCSECGRTVELYASFENRQQAVPCTCGEGELKYQFPMTAIKGFQPFEAYYDEAADCDFTGQRDKKEKLKILELQEAGDRVGGARNFDEKAPHHVKPLPPRGAVPVSKEIRRAAIERQTREEWDVSVEKKDGSIRRIDWGEARDV